MDVQKEDIARIRGFEAGKSITSPARYPDILSRENLKDKVTWLREKSGGKPIGIKFAGDNGEHLRTQLIFDTRAQFC